jgi:hypothetical protein
MRTTPLFRVAVILCGLYFLTTTAPGADVPAATPPAAEPAPKPAAPPVRPPMPVRAPDGPGAPAFKIPGAKPGDSALRAAAGVNPPVDAEGDWIVGPEYLPAPETKEIAGVPRAASSSSRSILRPANSTPALGAMSLARWTRRTRSLWS